MILCLLLIVGTLALYNPASRHPFVNYDDDRYVVENPHIQQGVNWSTVVWAFTTTSQANWHPLTWLSHALDYQLFHSNPAGHHYSNVLLHATNVVLLFLLLQWTTGFTWRSLMVAALFALHPINVESVAWISERKNLLSMLFFLLALWSYGWYARRPGVGRYALVALLFAFGLMAKPQVITLPFVLLLWDYWPLRRMFPGDAGSASVHSEDQATAQPLSWLMLEKLPLLALSAASALITVWAQREGGAVRSLVEYSLPVRAANAVVSYARYVGKAFWPSRLALFYPHPKGSLPRWEIAAAGLLLLVVTVLVLAARRQRYLVVGWFWFLGTLVPMIGLVQVGPAAMADRYAYLSYIGLFVMVCWGLAEWAKRKQVAAKWLAIPSFAALLALGIVTQRQLNYWSDNVTLWSHTLQVTEDNFLAEDNLGNALLALGRTDEAMPHFEAAVKIDLTDPEGTLNLATHAQEIGNLREAVDLYLRVIGMTSDAELRANAFSNMGAAYLALGDPVRAKASFEAALRLVPANVHGYIGMGLLAVRGGDYSAGAEWFSRAVAIQPTDVSYLLLTRALQRAGRASEAQAAYEEAQHISKNLSAAQQAADRLLAE